MPGPLDSPLTDLTRDAHELFAREERLEGLVRDMESRFSGLKDIDIVLELARVKLQLCMVLMKKVRGSGFEELGTSVGRRAASAIRLVESIATQNVSEDQKGIVQASPLFAEVRSLFEEFLVAGGGGFLEPLQIDERKKGVLARTVVTSIRKYMGEDDRYPPLDIERFPFFLQGLLRAIFPVFIRLRPQKPPYGIEEGEELTYRSPAMRLPLSQAIHYMENELLPGLERKLSVEPGHLGLQEQKRRVSAKLEEYKNLRVLPRAAPVLPLAKGLYTEAMTGFSPDGEILVSIPVAVSFRSGTNLDRKMELVRMDVVRRIAGRGVSAEIDREYKRLRSIESGPRGSSRTPSFKLDPSWGFWVLRQAFPFLSCLSDKRGFEELVQVVRTGTLGEAERFVAALISRESSWRLRDSKGPQKPQGDALM